MDSTETGWVQQWIAASESNRVYFDQLRKVWDTSLQVATRSTIDENKAWEKFKRRIQTTENIVPIQKARTNWLRIAASVLLVIGLGGAIFWFSTKEMTGQPVLLATTTNALTDTLPDGSIVTLNKRSSISYPSRFNKNKRAIELKGEAFFNVTPDKTKPFIITVNDVEVKVVGTSFNVKNENNITEVVVETGIVQVIKSGRMIELHPGQRTVLGGVDSAMQAEPVKDRLYNYYRSREFVCDDTPLWKLVEVLNEAYETNIVIGRSELRNLSITTTFNNAPLDEVLVIVSETLGLKITRTADKIILE